MRSQLAAIALLAIGSAGTSGFILGRNYPNRESADIPTRQGTLESMADEVGLDARQRSEVRAISDRYHARVEAVRRSVASDLADIRSSVRAETRAIMNEDQKCRFDDYCARRDEERAEANR